MKANSIMVQKLPEYTSECAMDFITEQYPFSSERIKQKVLEERERFAAAIAKYRGTHNNAVSIQLGTYHGKKL